MADFAEPRDDRPLSLLKILDTPLGPAAPTEKRTNVFKLLYLGSVMFYKIQTRMENIHINILNDIDFDDLKEEKKYIFREIRPRFLFSGLQLPSSGSLRPSLLQCLATHVPNEDYSTVKNCESFSDVHLNPRYTSHQDDQVPSNIR